MSYNLICICIGMPDVVPQNTGGVGGEGIRAVAIYDYQAADDDELSFDPDDIIYDIEKVNIYNTQLIISMYTFLNSNCEF